MGLLKGNLHTHTHLSDGLLSPEAVIARYRALGYDFLAITDHDDRIGEDYWERIPRGDGDPLVFVGMRSITSRWGSTWERSAGTASGSTS